ncbi:oligosaccharide flippase family protein [Acidisoma cellulosilytica]|uniref:Oligosaccharide flippase family protein n=1 Tax=Acidisoma cellulosilyticum TaxID=2802395 RepID=A0A963Z4G5_9PROT|nr:oligosaccharide flippase family protein [Acidisoma cellulosilyticum]MCB8881742.1 oligosaccharide flippase family protein [Acidisoma cellulosilyticum]
MADTAMLKRLGRNLVSTTVFQASGYLLAAINVPYLTRTLGVADYGVLAFVISINAYLYIIIDWGFSLGSTRDVAQASGDEDKLRDIFWRTMTAKMLLSLLSTAVLFALLPLNRVPAPIYLLLPGLLNIFGAVVTVDWFVQGLERMGMFTIYSIAGRSLVVLLTFIMVHGPKDTWIACALQGVGSIASGLAGFYIACRYLKMGRPRFPLRSAVRQIWQYRHYFLSQSSWIAYSTAAPLVLALVAGSAQVGLFAGADRMTRIAMALTVPASMVMYPRVNALLAQSRLAAAKVAGPFLGFQLLVAVALGAVFFLGADPIATIVLGPQFHKSADVLRWLSALPLLTGIAGTLARQFLIPLGWSRDVSRITIVFTLLYLVLLVGGCFAWGATGAAIALITSELLLSAAFTLHLLKHEREFTLASLAALSDTPRHVTDVARILRDRVRPRRAADT